MAPEENFTQLELNLEVGDPEVVSTDEYELQSLSVEELDQLGLMAAVEDGLFPTEAGNEVAEHGANSAAEMNVTEGAKDA